MPHGALTYLGGGGGVASGEFVADELGADDVALFVFGGEAGDDFEFAGPAEGADFELEGAAVAVGDGGFGPEADAEHGDVVDVDGPAGVCDVLGLVEGLGAEVLARGSA